MEENKAKENRTMEAGDTKNSTLATKLDDNKNMLEASAMATSSASVAAAPPSTILITNGPVDSAKRNVSSDDIVNSVNDSVVSTNHDRSSAKEKGANLQSGDDATAQMETVDKKPLSASSESCKDKSDNENDSVVNAIICNENQSNAIDNNSKGSGVEISKSTSVDSAKLDMACEKEVQKSDNRDCDKTDKKGVTSSLSPYNGSITQSSNLCEFKGGGGLAACDDEDAAKSGSRSMISEYKITSNNYEEHKINTTTIGAMETASGTADSKIVDGNEKLIIAGDSLDRSNNGATVSNQQQSSLPAASSSSIGTAIEATKILKSVGDSGEAPIESVICKEDNTKTENMSTRASTDNDRSDMGREDDETRISTTTNSSIPSMVSQPEKTEQLLSSSSANNERESSTTLNIAATSSQVDNESSSCLRAAATSSGDGGSSGGVSKDNGNENSISSTPSTEELLSEIVGEESKSVANEMMRNDDKKEGEEVSDKQQQHHREHSKSCSLGGDGGSGSISLGKSDSGNQKKDLIMSSAKIINSTNEAQNATKEDGNDANDKTVRSDSGALESTDLAQSPLRVSGEVTLSSATPSSQRYADSISVSRPPPQRPKLLANLKPKSPELPLDDDGDESSEEFNVKDKTRDSLISSSEGHSVGMQHLKSAESSEKEPTTYINKRSSLYVKNPDFSKKVPVLASPTNSISPRPFAVGSTSSREEKGYKLNQPQSPNDLSPLRMKAPDFSRLTSSIAPPIPPLAAPKYAAQSQFLPEQMVSNTTPVSSQFAYNKKPSVTPSNFEEMSKKYNYISDLQLKPPTGSMSNHHHPGSSIQPSLSTFGGSSAFAERLSVQHKIVNDQGSRNELHNYKGGGRLPVDPTNDESSKYPMKSGSAKLVEAGVSEGSGMYKTLYVSTPEFTSQKFHNNPNIQNMTESLALANAGVLNAPVQKHYSAKTSLGHQEPAALVIHKSTASTTTAFPNPGGPTPPSTQYRPKDDHHMTYTKLKVYDADVSRSMSYNPAQHIPPSNSNHYANPKGVIESRRPLIDYNYPMASSSVSTRPSEPLILSRPKEIAVLAPSSGSSKESDFSGQDQGRYYSHSQYTGGGNNNTSQMKTFEPPGSSYHTSVIKDSSRTTGPPLNIPSHPHQPAGPGRYAHESSPSAISLRQHSEGLYTDLKRIQSPSQATIGHNSGNVVEYSRQGYNTGSSALPNHMQPPPHGWYPHRSSTPQSPHLGHHSPTPSFVQPSPKASPSPTNPYNYQQQSQAYQRTMSSTSPQIRHSSLSPSPGQFNQKSISNEPSRHLPVSRERDFYGKPVPGHHYGDMVKSSSSPNHDHHKQYPSVHSEKYASTGDLNRVASSAQNPHPIRPGFSENSLRQYSPDMHGGQSRVDLKLFPTLPPKKQIKADEQFLQSKYGNSEPHQLPLSKQTEQSNLKRSHQSGSANAVASSNHYPDYSKYPQATMPPTIQFAPNNVKRPAAGTSSNSSGAESFLTSVPSSSRVVYNPPPPPLQSLPMRQDMYDLTVKVKHESPPPPAPITHQLPSTSSVRPAGSAGIAPYPGMPVVKRESPLDLSVKTVKTKADSTGEYEDISHHQVVSSMNLKCREPRVPTNSLKVNYVPNFSQHRENAKHESGPGRELANFKPANHNVQQVVSVQAEQNPGVGPPVVQPSRHNYNSPNTVGIPYPGPRNPVSNVPPLLMKKESTDTMQNVDLLSNEHLKQSHQLPSSSAVAQKPQYNTTGSGYPNTNSARDQYYYQSQKSMPIVQHPTMNQTAVSFPKEHTNRPQQPPYQAQHPYEPPPHHQVPHLHNQSGFNPYGHTTRDGQGVNERKRSLPDDLRDTRQSPQLGKVSRMQPQVPANPDPHQVSQSQSSRQHYNVLPPPASNVQYPPKGHQYHPSHSHNREVLQRYEVVYPNSDPREVKYNAYEKNQCPTQQYQMNTKPEPYGPKEPNIPPGFQTKVDNNYDRQHMYYYQGPTPSNVPPQVKSQIPRDYPPQHYGQSQQPGIPAPPIGSVEARNWYPPPNGPNPPQHIQPSFYPQRPPQTQFGPELGIIPPPNTQHLTDVTVIPYIKPGPPGPLSQSYAHPPENVMPVPIFHGEVKHNPKVMGPADRDVIYKLKNTIEEKQHQKLMTQKQNNLDFAEDDPNKADIAARIRTKGELKGFVPAPPQEPDRKVELVPPPSQPVNPQEKIDPPSDMEGTSAFDLMDWGSACNDFVEQLQTGKKKIKRRKTRKSDAAEVKLEVKEEVVESKLVSIPLESTSVEGETENAVVKMIKSKGDPNEDHSSSSDENKPLLLLRQQSINADKVKISESDATSNMSSKNSRMSDKSIKEKRLEQEKRIAARLGNISSSDSESETQKSHSSRRKKVSRKTTNNAKSKNSCEESGHDKEGTPNVARKKSTNAVVTTRRKSADSKKRKKVKDTSSESEAKTKNKGKKPKKSVETSDKSSESEDETVSKTVEKVEGKGGKQKLKKQSDSSNNEDDQKVTRKPGRPVSRMPAKSPVSIKPRTKSTSKIEKPATESSDSDSSSVGDKKPTELIEAAGSSSSSKGKNASVKPKNGAAAKSLSDAGREGDLPAKKSMSPSRTVQTRRNKSDVGPTTKAIGSEDEKTMTRSKKKLELETEKANSKVLRNKVVKTVLPNVNKRKEVTPKKVDKLTRNSTTSTTTVKNEKGKDVKRKILDTNSEWDKSKKKTLCVSSTSSSSSADSDGDDSSSSKSEADTAASVRLRPRLSKNIIETESSSKAIHTAAASSTAAAGDSLVAMKMTKMFNSSSNNLNKATSVKGKLLGTDEKKGGVTVGSGINNNNLSTTNKNNTTTQATTAAAPSTTNSGRKGKRSQQQQPPIDEVKAANKFGDGWEEQLYEFKRSLKVPPSLISMSAKWHRVSSSLPDLDRRANSDDEILVKVDEKKADQLSNRRSVHPTNSIIDMVHRRVVPTKIAIVAAVIVPEEVKNVCALLPTPVLVKSIKKKTPAKKGSAADKDKKDVSEEEEEEIVIKNVFHSKVIKSRTRTEQKVMKNKEIIREIFVGEERPASAPPRCNNDPKRSQQRAVKNEYEEIVEKKTTYEQQYEEYLKMYNCEQDDHLENIKKNQPVVSIAEQASLPKDLIPMVNAVDKLQMRLMRKKQGKKTSRRKGSSGFDYIRKKKKPTPISAGANGTNSAVNGMCEVKRRPVIEFVKERGEQDISKEIKGWVLNKGVGESVLHKAARLNYLDVVAYCLDRLDMSPDQKDNAGYTPLHEACSKGHLKIAKLLLQYGANHSETAQSGIRPLHDAVENGFKEVVRLLLAYGADPQLATYSGQTPLALAEEEHMEIFLKDHLYDLQYFGGDKKGWRFWGSWKLCEEEDCGYNVFAGAPDHDTNALKNKRAATLDTSQSSFLGGEIKNESDSIKARSLNLTVEKLAEELNGLKKLVEVPKTVTTTKRKSVDDHDNQTSDEGALFEFEESDMPLPPVYLLRDEGTEKWVMLTDLLNLLKLKSKETLLKQICPPNTPNSTKEMVREFKINDFLQKAHCLQLLCSGEKLNIRASKVILVKYTESVQSLLGVQTVVMRL